MICAAPDGTLVGIPAWNGERLDEITVETEKPLDQRFDGLGLTLNQPAGSGVAPGLVERRR